MLRNRTRVQPCAARSRNFSPSGIATRPSIRVNIAVCETSGTVNSVFSAAAAANAALTPGTISYATPARSSKRICSSTAPYMDGSPLCTRATSSPARAAPIISALISSSVSALLPITRAPGLAESHTEGCTSESA